MNNNNEKDILSYLEGEIKIDNETDLIHIGNHIDIMVHLWPGGNRIVARKEVCDFIATALINERERRKERQLLVGVCTSVSNDGYDYLDIPDREEIKKLLPCNAYLSGDYAEDGRQLIWLEGSSKDERNYVHPNFLKITPKKEEE